MKTKALLLAGLVSLAGVAASQAQTVYSVNAVGFVNVTVPTGFSLIANPLLNGDNTVATVLTGAPNGATIYKFNTGTGSYVSSTKSFGTWNNPLTIAPGEGFFLRNTGAPYTLTFTGEVAQGSLANPIVAGFQIVSSQVPVSGALVANLNFPSANGDVIYRFDSTSQTYTSHTYSFGSWGGNPQINVAEAFFSKKNGATSWSRTFSVSN
jgi:hypothetical protein